MTWRRVLSIEVGSHDDPWTEEDFLRAIRQRNCIGMTAEVGNKVVSFFMYELGKHYLRLLNFAVDPAFRRKRIGTQMIDRLKSKLSAHRRTHVDLIVPDDGLPSHLFLRVSGFRCIDVVRGFFGDADGYLMRHTVDGADEPFDVSINRIARYEEEEA